MRLGVLVRVDDRGLGYQSRAVARRLGASELVVLPSADRAAGYEQRVPKSARCVEWGDDGALRPLATVREWLRTVDVVYSAETFYDPTFVLEAEKAGVRTVAHVNPELWRGDWPAPSRVWLPTSWLADRFPGARVVPMPVEADEAPAPAEPSRCPVVVHTVGRAALGDRNGTTIVQEALQRLAGPCAVRMYSQDATVAASSRVRRTVPVTTYPGGVVDRWSMYADAHVLVLPRRYGGNCLPVGEAMAAGLAVVMPDCSPNLMWPIVPVPIRGFRQRRMVGGLIPVATMHPRQVADVLQRLVSDADALAKARAGSLAWAVENSWEALEPLWRAEFAAL